MNYDEEFLAAHPKGLAPVSEPVSQERAELDKCCVSNRMPLRIVDVFEVVEVDCHEDVADFEP